jgi:hypothetical protein
MTSTIKVNNIQNQCGANIINENSDTITIGASGDTIALASGASQTGFGRTGTVDWQTSSIKTATFTAANGEGYFADTSSGAFTVNLPAGSAGAIVAFSDYTRTFQTNNLTISPNGSEKIGGISADAKLNINGQSATFVYVDGTEGWINVQNAEDTETGIPPFIAATGGTTTECGDFKIHTFTGPGTFCVSNAGAPAGSTTLEYIVVAGGGGSGFCGGNAMGGGGAGGFRFAGPSLAPLTYPGKPLSTTGLTASITSYPITVGSGGSPGGPSSGGQGGDGANSIFSTITSAGGGKGGKGPTSSGVGGPGGSGGGGAGGGFGRVGGTGNTPPVSPAQGTNGGNSTPASPLGPDHASGGGGGAICAGTNGRPPSNTNQSGPGGDGAGIPTAFGSNGVPCGSFRYYAGGGGGEYYAPVTSSKSTGGKGGGGAGGGPVYDGVTNSGGGGGGGGTPGCKGGGGGSGIVIIRYKFQ